MLTSNGTICIRNNRLRELSDQKKFLGSTRLQLELTGVFWVGLPKMSAREALSQAELNQLRVRWIFGCARS